MSGIHGTLPLRSGLAGSVERTAKRITAPPGCAVGLAMNCTGQTGVPLVRRGESSWTRGGSPWARTSISTLLTRSIWSRLKYSATLRRA